MEAMGTQEMADAEDTWIADLAKLREPFPPERIEKLPKPMWKDAWKDQRGSKCDICSGYHVAANTIHLDYVGHANVTDRLLEVDPCWDWEPMAYTQAGTPLFSDGGLWIKLTVLGVTRIGYGDGKNPKEIIGDAIRNAAMRFGVGLDLWAKIDLHAERNPGDGEAPQSRRRPDSGPVRGQDSDQPSNRDALDALASACREHGYDQRSCGRMFREWSDQHNRSKEGLKDAPSDDINDFTAYLIDMATAEPADGSEPVDAGGDDVGAPEGSDGSATADGAEAGGDREGAPGDAGDSDTSSEAQDMF